MRLVAPALTEDRSISGTPITTKPAPERANSEAPLSVASHKAQFLADSSYPYPEAQSDPLKNVSPPHRGRDLLVVDALSTAKRDCKEWVKAAL